MANTARIEIKFIRIPLSNESIGFILSSNSINSWNISETAKLNRIGFGQFEIGGTVYDTALNFRNALIDDYVSQDVRLLVNPVLGSFDGSFATVIIVFEEYDNAIFNYVGDTSSVEVLVVDESSAVPIIPSQSVNIQYQPNDITYGDYCNSMRLNIEVNDILNPPPYTIRYSWENPSFNFETTTNNNTEIIDNVSRTEGDFRTLTIISNFTGAIYETQLPVFNPYVINNYTINGDGITGRTVDIIVNETNPLNPLNISYLILKTTDAFDINDTTLNWQTSSIFNITESGYYRLYIKDEFNCYNQYSIDIEIYIVGDRLYDLNYKISGSTAPFNVKLYKESDKSTIISTQIVNQINVNNIFQNINGDTEYCLLATNNIGDSFEISNIYTGDTYSFNLSLSETDGNYIILNDGGTFKTINSQYSNRYRYNKEITLTAYSNDVNGYQFNGWSDGYSGNTRTITLTNDLNITANFSKITHNVIILPSTGILTYIVTYSGTTSQGSSHGKIINDGEILNVTTSAQNNNYLIGWITSDSRKVYKTKSTKKQFIIKNDLHIRAVTELMPLQARPNIDVSISNDLIGSIFDVYINGEFITTLVKTSTDVVDFNLYDVKLNDSIKVILRASDSIIKFPSNTWNGIPIYGSINNEVYDKFNNVFEWYDDNNYAKFVFIINQDMINNINNNIIVKLNI